MSDHYLYLIAEAKDDWPVKVGVAMEPMARLITLQTGNSRRLRLVQKWRFAERRHAFEMERAILNEMSPYAEVGEWIAADGFGMRHLINDRIKEWSQGR